MSKYNLGLKTLLQECLSELEFYSDVVYKFKKTVGKTDFRYNLIRLSFASKDRLQHGYSAVVNALLVDNFASFFNCTTVGQF